MYTIPELVQLLDTTEEAVRAAASKLGITEDTVKDDYIDSIEREIKDSRQSAIAPVSKTPVKQVASASIVPTHPDPELQAELTRIETENRKEEERIDAELQQLESGSIVPVESAGMEASDNLSIKTMELPDEDEERAAVISELEESYAGGEQIADLKIHAATIGHDVRMQQGYKALLKRRVSPFGVVKGEVELSKPDWGKTVELTNPFKEGI